MTSTLVRATVMSAGDCSGLSSDMAASLVPIHEGLCVRSFYSNDGSVGWQMAAHITVTDEAGKKPGALPSYTSCAQFEGNLSDDQWLESAAPGERAAPQEQYFSAPRPLPRILSRPCP